MTAGPGVSTTMAPATAASASRIGVRLMAISGSSSRRKNLARGRGFVAAKLLGAAGCREMRPGLLTKGTLRRM